MEALVEKLCNRFSGVTGMDFLTTYFKDINFVSIVGMRLWADFCMLFPKKYMCTLCSNLFSMFQALARHILNCTSRKYVLYRGGYSSLMLFGADVKQWEYISYCLSQLSFTDKGIKKLMDLFKTYEHVLSQDSVMDHFKNIVNKVCLTVHKSTCYKFSGLISSNYII